MPTLEIDGLVLTQSVAILEYIEETRATGFLPTDPAARARVRACPVLCHNDGNCTGMQPVCPQLCRPILGRAIAANAWQVHFMQLGLAAVKRMLDNPATGLCCHGDSVTIADICLVPQIYNARRAKTNLAAYPRIVAIMAHLETMPAITAAHPDQHKPVS